MTRPIRSLAIGSLAMAVAAAALAFANGAEARAHHHHHHHAASAPAAKTPHGRHAATKAAPSKTPPTKADTASNGTVDKWTAAWARRHHVKLKGMVDTTPKEAKPSRDHGRHHRRGHEAAAPTTHGPGRRHHGSSYTGPAHDHGRHHGASHASAASSGGGGNSMCQSVRIHGQWVQRCHFPGQ
jgi:hypothetical protein